MSSLRRNSAFVELIQSRRIVCRQPPVAPLIKQFQRRGRQFLAMPVMTIVRFRNLVQVHLALLADLTYGQIQPAGLVTQPGVKNKFIVMLVQ